MPIQKYYEHHVGHACGIKISTEDNKHGSKFYQIDYYATDKCKNEIIVNHTESGYCASENNTLLNVHIFKCCTTGHFCNMNLTTVGIYAGILNSCHYKPAVLLALGNKNICEMYYDLNEKKRVYLYRDFNVKIIYEKEIYVYGKILKADSTECGEKHLYNEDDSKTFFRITCTTKNCDELLPELRLNQFECQHLKDKSYADNNEEIPKNAENDNWICYIQINGYYEKPQINAGHLNFNDTKYKSKIKECHDKGIYDSNFCCVNIVLVNQTDSNCTVEKQRVRFKETKSAIENPSESGNSNNNHG
uniref:Uncharacterized protein n=1 Tax=Panagrolaimus sp. ES5 TaxID=591445 RepID=A0AC34FQD7_9BILA